MSNTLHKQSKWLLQMQYSSQIAQESINHISSQFLIHVATAFVELKECNYGKWRRKYGTLVLLLKEHEIIIFYLKMFENSSYWCIFA